MKNKLLKFVLAFIMMFVPMTMITNVNASETSPLKVSAEISDRPDLKVFKVYNSSNEDLEYTYNATGKDINAHIQAGQTNTHEFKNQQGTIVFQLVDEKGRYSIPCQSLSSYKLRVRYLYQGDDLQSPSFVTCSPSAVSRITAPKTISKNGRVYDIVGGNYREASYGETSVDFKYTMRSRDDFQSVIVFLDQDGNTLKRDKMNVSESNGGSYAVPQTLEHNQRQYRLMAGYGDIQQSYDEGVKTHYVRYQLQANTSNAPYYITIDYRDGNTLLARKTLTVQKGKSVSHLAPSVYNVGTTSYKLVGNGQVTHQYGDDTKNYTVQYAKEVTDRNQPYDVYVHYIDVATGKTLKSDKQNVGVSKTVKFEVPGSVTSANKNYILSAGQPKTITHKFGNEQTVVLCQDFGQPK